MNFDRPPTAEDLEKYRGYLKLFAQMKLSVRLRTKEDASDVVQRVMLAAFKDLHQFRGTTEAELQAWLRQIAANQVKKLVQYYKRLRREIAREVPIATSFDHSSMILYRALIGSEPEPSTQLIAKEQCDQLVDALQLLLDDERSVVVLRHLHRWSFAEIAQHIGRSEPAVAGLHFRAMDKLRLQFHASK